ncbi:MAG: hypothetical protein ACK40V_04605 [Anaerolineales bacterium]
MSKLTRIALALVISLVIVAGVYFSVQALSSAVVRQQSLGMYLLNGSLVNPLKKESAQPELQTYPTPKGHEGGCDREGDNSSDL